MIRLEIQFSLMMMFLLFGVLILPAQQLTNQDSASAKKSNVTYNIFSYDSPLTCSLTFDIKKFLKQKKEGKYQDAVFTLVLNDTIEIETESEIKARGVSRRKLCNFPPIKLKFKKPDFPFSYFNNIKNQKVVTHCKSADEYEQNLLKEYLVYKMYNILSDKSFRVQLLEMQYVDSELKVETMSKHAFLIEEPEFVAERNDAFYVKDENLGMRYIQPENMMTLSLFQLMIGNPDWSITGLHNIKLLKSKDFNELQPFAIPYDFDNSGIVNPSYAEPPESSGLGSVLERKFEGICSTEEDYDKIIEKYNDHKQDFLSLVSDFDLLDDDSKKHMIEYIESFYELLNSQKFYKKQVLPFCKQ